jgi:hypothetical protein
VIEVSENNTSPRSGSNATITALELAVPILSLGGGFLAILVASTGSIIDARFFATGCILGSFILAYLSWIRPKKDIVSLTTPLYAIFFFVMPSDYGIGIPLVMLYAVSLTLLLVRLKYRFGTAVLPEDEDAGSLPGPLEQYCATVQGISSAPDIVHDAALVFLRFARSEYQEAAQVAGSALEKLGAGTSCPLLATAFTIVREQALLSEDSLERPEDFTDFFNDASLLAKPQPDEEKTADRYEVALDNALLLLFAVAWNTSGEDRPALRTGLSLAVKLLAR